MNPFGVGHDPRHFDVFVNRRPADVHDDGRLAGAKLGQLLVDEAPDADPLKPDRIEHAGGRLDDPRRRMTFSLPKKQPFDDNSAQGGEIHDIGVLDAISEAAAGRHQRVFEVKGADGD